MPGEAHATQEQREAAQRVAQAIWDRMLAAKERPSWEKVKDELNKYAQSEAEKVGQETVRKLGVEARAGVKTFRLVMRHPLAAIEARGVGNLGGVDGAGTAEVLPLTVSPIRRYAVVDDVFSRAIMTKDVDEKVLSRAERILGDFKGEPSQVDVLNAIKAALNDKKKLEAFFANEATELDELPTNEEQPKRRRGKR